MMGILLLLLALMFGGLLTVGTWLVANQQTCRRRIALALGSGLLFPVATDLAFVVSVTDSGGDADVVGFAIIYLVVGVAVMILSWFAASSLILDVEE